jgi:hypothetical protein
MYAFSAFWINRILGADDERGRRTVERARPRLLLVEKPSSDLGDGFAELKVAERPHRC